MIKTIWLYLCCLVCTLLPLHCYSAQLSLDCRFDKEIESAVKRFSPGRDPDLLKAQLWQESRFRVDAVSPVGAQGVAQFMPATWQEQTAKLGIAGSPLMLSCRY